MSDKSHEARMSTREPLKHVQTENKLSGYLSTEFPTDRSLDQWVGLVRLVLTFLTVGELAIHLDHPLHAQGDLGLAIHSVSKHPAKYATSILGRP